MPNTTVTIVLPDGIAERMRKFIAEGAAQNPEDFVLQAIAHACQWWHTPSEQTAIAAEFAKMADDADYQELA